MSLRWGSGWTAAGMLVLPAARPAGAQTCAAPLDGAVLITTATVTGLPEGTKRLFVFDPQTGRGDSLSAPTAAGWTPSLEDRGRLAAAQAAGPRAIEFAKEDGTTICTRSYNLLPVDDRPARPGSGGGAAPAGATTRKYDEAEDCGRLAGPAWVDELTRRRGRNAGGFTVLVFMEGASAGDGSICYYNRDYGVVGDPIHVGVFRKSLTWTGVRFEPCALQAAAPNILQSSERFPSLPQGAGAWELQTFLPRRCFNAAVDVSIVGDAGGTPVRQRYPLSQYDRYRATLQAGMLFTPLHDTEFALRADQSDTTRKFIYDRGPTDRGPEYIATLQIYSILRYLPSLLGKGVYAGRDPVNEQSLTDRLGAVVGVGLRNPGNRFVAGLSFELIYGLSALGVIDFAQVTRLQEDVSTTEPFLGTAASIPTRESWRNRVTFGLSLDLRYVAALFSGGH